jgi:capsular exopolysaccharide synthesis family protein
VGESSSIKEILSVLKKRWEIIIITALTVTIMAVILSFYIIPPTYEANTKIFMRQENKSNNDNNDESQINKNLIKTYSELIQTNDFIDKIIRENNFNINSEDILKELSVIPNVETQILEVKLRGRDKYFTEKILESICDELVKESKKINPYSNAKIIESVKLPKWKKSPNEATNIGIGSVLGVMLGILFVILLENFNTKISNKGQLEKAISVPVIGCIPGQKNNGRGSRYRVLSFENNPNSVQAEAYRQLRNNISYSFDKEAFSIISIISPDGNTGKSTVASNIALAFSEVNKNVIIVDCNLRNPTLHKIFNISNMQGLSDVFVGREKVENVIREYCNNISVLPWGKVLINSSEILESNKIDEVLEHLKSNYDLVIIDTAAIQNFTDTHLLSSKVDGNIFVVKEDKTRIEELIDSKKILDKVGAKVIGTVLN